jgi:hypothetical protein
MIGQRSRATTQATITWLRSHENGTKSQSESKRNPITILTLASGYVGILLMSEAP